VTFSPNPTTFLYVWAILPVINIKDITIKNSQNANIFLNSAELVTISNVYIENARTAVKDVDMTFAIFNLWTAHAFTVNNLTAHNVSCPLLITIDVLGQNFSDFSLNNMSISQNVKSNYPMIIQIYKTVDPTQKGLDMRKSKGIYLDKINLDV